MDNLCLGIMFNGTVTLPTFGDYELGNATFEGLISPTEFKMTTEIDIFLLG
jgi:hypothetical protein